MRSLFNSHLGYNVVGCVCEILEQGCSVHQPPILRGAVSFLVLGLWGKERVISQRQNPSAVLLSCERGHGFGHILVTKFFNCLAKNFVKEFTNRSQSRAYVKGCEI